MEELDCLIINPPFLQVSGHHKSSYPYEYPPPGVMYLTASLKSAGYRAKIYNPMYIEKGKYFWWGVPGYPPKTDEERTKFKEWFINFPSAHLWQMIKNELKNFKPATVGISISSSCNHDSAFCVARLVKEAYPDVPIMVGGMHPTCLPEEMLANQDIDVVCIGEGEQTIVELVSAFLNKKDLSAINGIAYRENGTIKYTPPRTGIMDLDTIPMPTFQTDYYDYFPRRSLTMSRGCPFQCTFCSQSVIQLVNKKVRYRNPEKICDEIDYWYKQGIRHFVVQDSTFTLNYEHTMEICEAILKRGFKIDWASQVRADRVDFKLLTMMKKAGCSYIWMGAESGSERVLKSIKKNETREQIIEAAKVINKVGVDFNVFFIAGFPDDDEESIRDTESMAKLIECNGFTPNILVPYPGSEIYNYAVKNDKLVTKDWFFYISTYPYTYKRDEKFNQFIIEHYFRMMELSEKKRKAQIRKLIFKPDKAYQKIRARMKTTPLLQIVKKVGEAWIGK